nr:MAG TPA_asm: Late competence development protein ComFB [Caudoviricetes sp.]
MLDNVPPRYIMYLKATANRQDAHEVAAGGV